MKTRKVILLVLCGLLVLLVSGCFFSEQEIIIDEQGKADITISFWFKKNPMGAETEGSIAMNQLLFFFPEIQTYERNIQTKKESEDVFADEYLVYILKKKAIGINKNEFIEFQKRDDGSYLFEATVPQALREKSDEDEHIVTIKVTLPKKIDMANTMTYSGNTVEWRLRTNDFTKNIALKAYTVSG